MKIEGREETKMIQCIEVALNLSHESRMEKKQFTEDLYLTPACTFQPPSTITYSTHTYISGNKRKHQHCAFSQYTTYVVWRQKGKSIINKCRKLAQKENKTRHDLVGKMSH